VSVTVSYKTSKYDVLLIEKKIFDWIIMQKIRVNITKVNKKKWNQKIILQFCALKYMWTQKIILNLEFQLKWRLKSH